MSISFVQATGSVTNVDSSLTVNLTSGLAGDMIVLFLSNFTSPAITVSDSFSSNYQRRTSTNDGFVEIWTGILNGSDSYSVAVTWPNSGFHVLQLGEYNNVLKTGASGSTRRSTATPSLSIGVADPNSWLVGGILSEANQVTFSQNIGFIRDSEVFGITQAFLLDSTSGTTFNTLSLSGSGTGLWWEAVLELLPVPPIDIPALPSAIFPTTVRPPNRSYSDKTYPYAEILVVPTKLNPIPFICRKCRTPTSASIYRDVREYAVAMGIPSIRQGGIKKGERFDFIYCGACGTWYRKNDYRIVSNVRTMDIGINPALDPLGSLSTSFADEPGYMSDVANISTDSVRIAMNKNLFAFVDAFEPTGFIVEPIATGSIDTI